MVDGSISVFVRFFFAIETWLFGSSIKVLLLFGLPSWLSAYVFIITCDLNRHVYISEIVLNILDKLIHDSQNIFMFDIERNAHQTRILLRLTTTSSKRHHHLHLRWKQNKKNNITYSKFNKILCTSTETPIYWKYKEKNL